MKVAARLGGSLRLRKSLETMGMSTDGKQSFTFLGLMRNFSMNSKCLTSKR